jgi:hypothetical protein
MARSARKPRSSAGPKSVVEDNFVAPKLKPPVEAPVTFEEALAESGETVEELTAIPPEAERPVRPVGTSNLASTIRNFRNNYVTALRGEKKTQHNGDYVAAVLNAVPFEELLRFHDSRDGRDYSHLNLGHQRMCIGNLIRAAWKKGDEQVLTWLAANAPATLTEAGEDEGEE